MVFFPSPAHIILDFLLSFNLEYNKKLRFPYACSYITMQRQRQAQRRKPPPPPPHAPPPHAQPRAPAQPTKPQVPQFSDLIEELLAEISLFLGHEGPVLLSLRSCASCVACMALYVPPSPLPLPSLLLPLLRPQVPQFSDLIEELLAEIFLFRIA